MEDVIQVQDQYYTLANTSRAAERSEVLQHGDTFAVFDPYGDVGAFGPSDQGLYHEGTRYLSRCRLKLNNRRPLILSARVKEDNELFCADLTNPDIPLGPDGTVLARDLVHLFRARLVWDATWHERIRMWTYGRDPLRIVLTLEFAADFADIFEVRGTARRARGSMLAPEIGQRHVRIGYLGLDGETRWARIEWSETPTLLTATAARFEFVTDGRTPIALSFSIACERQSRPVAPTTYADAHQASVAALDAARANYATIESSSERFNQWVRRSAADLRMLVGRTPHGDYPYAGVPLFSTPFGRDGIITALQLLWINPQLARGVLSFLAATQADKTDPERDAEPGKILHETRGGEMARLGEVPFGRYYGSVDATPLFIILAGAYFDRTGDRDFAAAMWPHVERALEWIDRWGDRDGDGFVEYARQSGEGLTQQGWKDSQNSVFHADGTLAEAPIALCEVQAYVYEARRQAACLADALGHGERAMQLRRAAESLRAAFEDHFWCEEKATYALALDGRKRPCLVQTSNAGHCLFGGIASPDRARRVAQGLLGQQMFSGWGIRTVAADECRYNPMSYHNGSVWPHDNGLMIAGFSRYGFDDYTAQAFSALFDASQYLDSHRLPELVCGFHRRAGDGPALYPVACVPQAWASGVVFQLLQACLRLSLDVDERRLSIQRPVLPPFLHHLTLREIWLPFGSIDLRFEQYGLDVSVTVLKQTGDFEVRVVKRLAAPVKT